MKQRVFVVVLAICAVAGAEAQAAFAAHIGTNLFRYEQAYLTTGVTYLSELADQMELHLGADFGITTTRTDTGGVRPSFLVPFTTGLNFTFPSDPVVFYVGIGLIPTMLLTPDAEKSVRFFMGPYGRAGIRVKVHAIMSAFLDVEQDLLIGGPEWINTSTRIAGGIHFSFP
jgi:hypothetical protein